tara:strand:+ start:9588 stop:9842 length:255 start_codon:yes stop_codon:yes gene_type:complete
VAEGAPLLREYGVNSSIEGSNPSLSATKKPSYLTSFARKIRGLFCGGMKSGNEPEKRVRQKCRIAFLAARVCEGARRAKVQGWT